MKKFRWYILIMLALASLINYLDRSALSIAAPMITKEFHLNSAQMGLIFSSFFMGYALFNFVGGYLSDIYGPKKIFGLAMTVWSVFGGVVAMTTGFYSLFVSRVIFGFGEGPIGSGTNKTINNWFPKKERAGAVGLVLAAMPLGAAISGPVVGLISLHWGWRISFVLLMLLGLVWTWVWMKTVTDYPATHPRVTKAELRDIEDGQTVGTNNGQTKKAQAKKLPLKYFLKQPTIIALSIAFFATNYVLYFFLTWFPTYLVNVEHLNVEIMSVVTMIPWLVGMVAQAGGGFLSDFIYKKTNNAMFSRKIVIVVSLLVCAVGIVLSGFAKTTTSVVALMTVGMCFQYLTISNFWAIVQDAIPPENVGGVGGFVHFMSNLSGIIGPAATGFIVQYTGSFRSGFVVAGILPLIGMLGIALLVKPFAVSDANLDAGTQAAV